ncbi:hypothetical protein PLICRDRAFT_43800 [Plicaturopsis crispa FD-325 SS-3]|nr:hypothetical protein PLICRDRAFT_43800 [Plicaturopsis crispa FD-325 SS-3]
MPFLTHGAPAADGSEENRPGLNVSGDVELKSRSSTSVHTLAEKGCDRDVAKNEVEDDVGEYVVDWDGPDDPMNPKK